jgi:hypothetical protein
MTLAGPYVVIATGIALAGCSSNVQMHPVSGPLTALKPVPIINAKITGFGSSGEVTFNLPDGVICSGNWSIASGEMQGTMSDASGNKAAINLSGGAKTGAGAGSCTNNGTFQGDFISSGSHGHGTASDSMGNVYRVLF